jgi:hypothetical protein
LATLDPVYAASVLEYEKDVDQICKLKYDTHWKLFKGMERDTENGGIKEIKGYITHAWVKQNFKKKFVNILMSDDHKDT